MCIEHQVPKVFLPLKKDLAIPKNKSIPGVNPAHNTPMIILQREKPQNFENPPFIVVGIEK